MRTLILALTVLALTAVTAFTAGGVLVGGTEPGAPTRQIHSGGLSGIGQGGFLRGGAYDSFAKGDMMGDGGGGMMGDMSGDMMGSMGMMGR